MGHEGHKHKAPKSVKVFVVSISDTRTEADDESGAYIKEELEKAGHGIAGYRLIKDEPSEIVKLINAEASRGDLHAFILTGGTGISSRDSTFEAVRSLLEKEIEGFGEIFRHLSYQDIGASAIMSRAAAGSYHGKIIISIPGSLNAVKLAMEKLILPELGHMVYEVSR